MILKLVMFLFNNAFTQHITQHKIFKHSASDNSIFFKIGLHFGFKPYFDGKHIIVILLVLSKHEFELTAYV